jgi:hypothetical protein
MFPRPRATESVSETVSNNNNKRTIDNAQKHNCIHISPSQTVHSHLHLSKFTNATISTCYNLKKKKGAQFVSLIKCQILKSLLFQEQRS